MISNGDKPNSLEDAMKVIQRLSVIVGWYEKLTDPYHICLQCTKIFTRPISMCSECDRCVTCCQCEDLKCSVCRLDSDKKCIHETCPECVCEQCRKMTKKRKLNKSDK
jgi:hypothetical protein